MTDIIEEYSDPCDNCMHILRDYCKAYKVKIALIEVDKCKRRKRK